MRCRGDSGFTLLEIMIVVGIIGILAGTYALNAQAGLGEERRDLRRHPGEAR